MEEGAPMGAEPTSAQRGHMAANGIRDRGRPRNSRPRVSRHDGGVCGNGPFKGGGHHGASRIEFGDGVDVTLAVRPPPIDLTIGAGNSVSE